MSDQNDEITLAHHEYISSQKISYDDLPDNLGDEMEKIDALIDIYEADPTDANFDATEAASKSLKDKIQKWYEDKKAAEELAKKQTPPEVKVEQAAPVTPVATEVTQTVPVQAPPKPEVKEENDDDGWNKYSYTQFLK